MFARDRHLRGRLWPRSVFRPRGRLKPRVVATLAVVGLAAGMVVFVTDSALAATGLAPILDCVVAPAGSSTNYTAYFGYANTTSTQLTIAVGDNNQVYPASVFEGQPDFFNIGTFPKVFSVTFDASIFPTVSWILNGLQADATASSPACTAAVTTPASDLSTGGATLNGVVVPGGVDTTYSAT